MRAVRYRNFSIAAVCLLALGGCSVSPSVDAASWTVGAVSYLLTGKGAVDHAVSTATRQDCAIMRMVKKEQVCVPLDEDVAGDRLIFEFESPSEVGAADDEIAAGDPMRVNPAMTAIVEPLGGSVVVESRSAPLAAVAAEALPMHAIAAGEDKDGWRSMLSGLIKDKPAMVPDRATRLWLPVEE